MVSLTFRSGTGIEAGGKVMCHATLPDYAHYGDCIHGAAAVFAGVQTLRSRVPLSRLLTKYLHQGWEITGA